MSTHVSASDPGARELAALDRPAGAVSHGALTLRSPWFSFDQRKLDGRLRPVSHYDDLERGGPESVFNRRRARPEASSALQKFGQGWPNFWPRCAGGCAGAKLACFVGATLQTPRPPRVRPSSARGPWKHDQTFGGRN